MVADADAACLVLAAGENPAATVSLSHRNLSNLIYSIAKRPGINDRDVLVATSAPGLDRAMAEILLPLLTGARLVLAADADIVEGPRLLRLLQRTGATMMHATPAVWTRLVESGWVGAPALKMLCPGLELPGRLVDRLLSKGGELWSLYGYPETGIWSSVLRLTRRLPMSLIGEPIANTSLYVLDARLKATLVGATGDLYIANERAADLDTSVRADPLGTGQTLYLQRTGDLARLRDNGQIEYLGRVDETFDYEGRRVDATKLERLLRSDARVAQAALVRDSTTPSAPLIAYVVPRASESRDAQGLVEALRARLEASLAHELLPAAILPRETLPQLPDGRPDRRALEALATPESADAVPLSAEIEERLASIWASALGVDAKSIARTDNFFEMGGHSLLAARMLMQIEREFGRRIRLATLFTAPTLRELAKALAQAAPREFDFRQMVKIQPNGSRPPLICINNTGIYFALTKYLDADQPVISLQLFDPSVKSAAMPDTLEEIAAGYVELIGRVQPKGPYALMGWCAAGALAFEIARQLKQSGKEVSNLFLIDSWVPRYFARQPLLRATIGDYTLRWQFILADWRRILAGEKSFSAFWKARTFVKHLSGLFRRTPAHAGREADGNGQFETLETYDEWLLHYLQRVTTQYEPSRLSVRITLLRSREEPTGYLFRKDAGWGEFTSEPIELAFVDGNHFTMFKRPGVEQMARHIAKSIENTAQGTVLTGNAASP
jgi:thioesterase domain-containing protein/acyl carrier protein